MRNHIILEMSTLPGQIRESAFVYRESEENSYRIEECKGQLEPIPRLMLKKYPDDEEFYIYILCSQKTITHKQIIDDKEYTAVSFFEERIENCEEAQGKKIIIKTIEISDLRNPYEALTEVVVKLRNEYKKCDRLWIDTHGGLRDIAQIISAMMSLLKVYDIVPEEIFGVEINHGGVSEIYSHKEAFKIFDYVSGMDDFINFGSAKALNNYYSKVKNESILSILNAMDKIATGTQFCDPNMYTEGIKELRKSIKDIHDDPLLSIFADYIKQDYGEELIPTELDEQDKEVSPIAIIKRCVDKRLYQQALTFLESKMPIVYVKEGFIYTKNMDDIIIERDENKKKYMAPENYLFDSLLFYINKKGKDSSNEAKIARISQHYEKNGNRIIGEPLHNPNIISLDKLFLYANNKKIQMMTRFKKPSREKLFIQLMLMHWELKQCRNLFNHGNSNRPKITDIHNALKLYILYAEELLK